MEKLLEIYAEGYSMSSAVKNDIVRITLSKEYYGEDIERSYSGNTLEECINTAHNCLLLDATLLPSKGDRLICGNEIVDICGLQEVVEYPKRGLEIEVVYVVVRCDNVYYSDDTAIHQLLSQVEYRYSFEGVNTYELVSIKK